MPDFAVKSVFSAVDKISPAFRQMASSAEKFEKDSRRAFTNSSQSASKFSSIMKTGMAAVGVIGGFEIMRRGISMIVGEAANFENSIASFTTLLGGSEQEAQKLVGTLQKIGAETPFEFKDLSAASQRLLGFGVVTKDTVAPTLKMIGDLAQGNAEKLQGISLVYGQVMAGGKMMGQDFNQLVNQGVPIAQGLAKVWGVDVNEAIKRIKQNGPVAAADVQKAMEQMTGAGGLFYQGMMRSSKTLTGLWSTFTDAIHLTASGIGQEMLPMIKELVVSATEAANGMLTWVQANKEFIGGTIRAVIGTISTVAKIIWHLRYVILVFTVTWAIMKTLVLATKFAGVIKMLFAFRLEYIKLIAAQWGLNTAMLANPITWIIMGIVALSVAAIALYKNWDTVSAALGKGWDFIKEKVSAFLNFVLPGLKTVGSAIMTALLIPLNFVVSSIANILELASSIPGVGDKFKTASNAVKEFQASANNAVGSTNFFAPNQTEVNSRSQNNVNVNLYNANAGSTATVTPKKGATVKMERAGANR